MSLRRTDKQNGNKIGGGWQKGTFKRKNTMCLGWYISTSFLKPLRQTIEKPRKRRGRQKRDAACNIITNTKKRRGGGVSVWHTTHCQMKLTFRWKHTVTDASLWKRSELLCFLNSPPPSHVHAKEGEKKWHMLWVEFQVVEGWELGLAGSLCCRKPQDVSLTGRSSDEHTQNKADVRNNSMHEHAKYTLPTLTTFFLLVCCENNFNTPLGISPWITFRERNSGREDNLSERMREWRKGIKGKWLKSSSCSRALLDLMSYVFYLFFYYSRSLWWLSGD